MDLRTGYCCVFIKKSAIISISSNVDYDLSNEVVLATLIRRRGKIKASLTRVSTFIDRFVMSVSNVAEAASRLAMLPSIMNQFKDIQGRIEELDTEHDVEHVVTRDEFESRYYHIAGQLSRCVKSSSTVQHESDLLNASLHGTSIVSRTRSLLPTFPLESFDGDYAT